MAFFRLAVRSLRNSPRFSALYLLTLGIGLISFVVVDAFKGSLKQSISGKSQSYLSADLAISGRRRLTAEEWQGTQDLLPDGHDTSQIISFFTMGSVGDRSRLIGVRAVDEKFPFYGEFVLEGGRHKSDLSELHRSQTLWSYAEIPEQLGVNLGEQIKIGDLQFKISEIIHLDTGDTSQSFGLAPRVYLSQKHLEELNLLQRGSTAFYTTLVKVPQSVNIERLVRKLDAFLEDPALRVYTHAQASERTNMLLVYLNDYLGLVAIVALFLAGIGAGYLFRAYLTERIASLAVLRSLGATPVQAQWAMLYEAVLLGLGSAIIACFLGLMVLPGLSKIIETLTPFQLDVGLGWVTVVTALCLGIFGSVLLCLPLLQELRTLNPAILFQESKNPTLTRSRHFLVWYLPSLFTFWALSVWQSMSIKVGSLFVLAFLGSGALLIFLGSACLRWLQSVRTQKIHVKFAVRNLYRNRVSSLSALLAIGLGVTLINLLAQLEGSIQAEIERPENSNLPTAFLLDIQDEQVEPLKATLQQNQWQIENFSPFIEARILTVNGVPFEKSTTQRAITREQDRARRLRNRGFRLTYRKELYESERIVKGKPYNGVYSGEGTPEISIEQGFANRMGWDLGDSILFEIQGVELEAIVANIRKIRWASFQPNFFVQFPDGVLNEAPKTFLAVVPSLPPEEKRRLQATIVSEFPNISIVDVTQVMKRVLEIAEQIGWALNFMALLSFLAGMAVLYSIARHQAHTRRRDINLLKILGEEFNRIRWSICLEFGLLGLVAAALGVLASLASSYSLTQFLFEGVQFSVSYWPLLSLGLTPVISLVVAYLGARTILNQKTELV